MSTRADLDGEWLLVISDEAPERAGAEEAFTVRDGLVHSANGVAGTIAVADGLTLIVLDNGREIAIGAAPAGGYLATVTYTVEEDEWSDLASWARAAARV